MKVVYPYMLINVGKLVVSPKERDIYGAEYTTTLKRVRGTAGNRPAAIVDEEVRRYLRARWVRTSSHG